MVYTDSDDGELYLRIIDFGLVATEGSYSGVAGTPMYMPPEMWPEVPARPRITYHFDIYSAGETLYELICGKTFHENIFDTYGSRGERQIARALQTETPQRFCNPSESVAPLFDLVVKKMMSPSAPARASATKLLESGVFEGVVTTKHTPTTPSP